MILLYHKVDLLPQTVHWVSVDAFNRQMAALQAYDVVYLDDYDPTNPRHVVITFNGVYENVLTRAAPILKKWRYPFELFVIGNHIGKGNEFDQAAEPPAQFVSVEQLRKLVEIGGRVQWHSRSHKRMDGLPLEEIERELDVPDELRRAFPESHLRWFAYPHGDHSDLVVNALKSRFTGALSCIAGNDHDRYQLNRKTVSEDTRLDMSTVSIIIPNYNYGRLVGQAIESVLAQTVPPDEILVIDDASTDDSREVLRFYQDEVKVVYNEENLGIVRNFRKAVGLTSGDYIAFLGADNRMRADYVERCKAALDADPDVAVVSTDMSVFGQKASLLAERLARNPMFTTKKIFREDETGKEIYYWQFPNPTPERVAKIRQGNFIHGSSMYRRAAYGAVGGYQDENLPEDWDLFCRMLEAGWKAYRVPFPLIEYRQHSSDQANTVLGLELQLVHQIREGQQQLEQVVGEKDAHLKHLEAAQQQLEQAVGEKEAHIEHLEATQQQLEQVVGEKEAHLEHLEAERDERVAGLEAELEERAQLIATKDEQLEEKEETIQAMGGLIQGKDAALAALGREMEHLRAFYQRVSQIWPYRVYRYVRRPWHPNPLEGPVAGASTLPVAFRRWVGRKEPWSMKARRALRFIRWRLVPSSRERLFAKRAATAPAAPAVTPADPSAAPASAAAQVGIAEREAFLQLSEMELNVFLSSGETLALPCASEPKVSIILVLFNQAALSFACLRSIKETVTIPAEVIIVDNASRDETRDLLNKVNGAKVITNDTNRHFLRACNQAAERATGDHILFLNNDALLQPGSLEAAVATLERDERIGTVGGRIILLDGTLQEAGSIVWNDGSCLGYGRGDDPYAPAYMFRRDIDYCSAAFLLTRRRLFEELGGFDEAFVPAYYEDTDYCFRLRQRGYRTVYEPAATIIHYEFGSSSTEGAAALMAEHQRLFRAKHADRLARHLPPALDSALVARHADHTAPRILFIDDRTPHPSLGSGLPRANEILWTFVRLGAKVTFFATDVSDEPWTEVYADLPREAEIIVGSNKERLPAFLRERAGCYDAIFVSRPHNMETLRAIHDEGPELFSGVRIIYDAEAIFALRELARERLQGWPVSEDREHQMVQVELSLAGIAHDIVAVSEAEKRNFVERGFPRVHVLGHALAAAPTPACFDDRRDILFVGAIHDEFSPNRDSVLWFVRDIFPRIRSALPENQVRFLVVGLNKSKTIAGLAGADIKMVGRVESLVPYFDQARIFVAPTRFAAGLPYKVHDAAAHGLPVVGTRLIADQVGWEADQDLLVSETNDPEAFADHCVRLYTDRDLWQRLRANALKRIEKECSPQAFETVLRKLLTEVTRPHTSPIRTAPSQLEQRQSGLAAHSDEDIERLIQQAFARHIRWLIGDFTISREGIEIVGHAHCPKGEQDKARFLINGLPFDQVDFPLPSPHLKDTFWHLPNAENANFKCRKTSGLDRVFKDGYVRFDFLPDGTEDPLSWQSAWYVLDPQKELSVPDDARISRVIGTGDPRMYLLGGATLYKRFDNYLSHRTGKRLSDFRRILDWGCGSGRLTRYLAPWTDSEIWGADIDTDNIAWCRKHIPRTKFCELPLTPPSDLPESYFDLVIGISVLTHPNEDIQFMWLKELQRITTKGALVLLSIQGYAQMGLLKLPPEVVRKTAEEGFIDSGNNPQLDDVMSDKDYYINCFQSRDYIAKQWGLYFEIVDIVDAIAANQDLVVMRKGN